MKLIRICCIVMLVMGGVSGIDAQVGDRRQVRKLVRQGNREYRSEKRNEATVTYLKALAADSTYATAVYNYATSQFPIDWMKVDQQTRSTMIPSLMKAAAAEQNPLRKAQAYHNVGVLYQQASDYQMAIDAYKEALRNNPNDDESRYNLAVCKKQQKNQPQDQSQQGQDKDQNGNQQKKEQLQDQQNQDDQKDQQQQEPPMSKENAEQLLQAAMQQEKKTQDRLKDAQKQPRRRRIEKNW
ncbi:MAG: tetratricopeptide repeat protein [Prevotella sp.]|nr:tetratricopeptide repeat protein [Prevotella sp.]